MFGTKYVGKMFQFYQQLPLRCFSLEVMLRTLNKRLVTYSNYRYPHVSSHACRELRKILRTENRQFIRDKLSTTRIS